MPFVIRVCYLILKVSFIKLVIRPTMLYGVNVDL